MPEEKVSQQECKCPTGAKYHVYGCALDGELLAAADAGPRQPEACGEPAASFIPRWGMYFTCVLPKGHEGEHRQGGTCFKHGEYVGEKCPKWPDCSAPVPQEAAPAPGTVATFMDMDMRLDTTMPVGQVDVQDSKGRRTIIPATAPDSAMRVAEQAHKWIDEHIPLQFEDSNVTELDRGQLEQLLSEFASDLIRQAGSERERRLLNWFIKYAEDAEKSWTKDGERTVTAMSWGQAVSEFRAAASRLLGGESK